MSGIAVNVLLICNYDPYQAATVQDHIAALSSRSKHRFFVYSGIGELPQNLRLDRFDAIVIHYSIFVANDTYLGPVSRYHIRMFRGTKVMFIQDEYRHVNATIAAIDYLGIDVLYTCVPESEWEKVYPRARLPGLQIANVLTAYVPEALLERTVPATENRPVDVGYRGRRYPAWHGSLGRERVTISTRFVEDAKEYGLTCDCSVEERARLYGWRWIRFLTRCKAVLGTESGANVFDFTGEIDASVRRHVALHPTATYEELRDRYFLEEEDRIKLAQISPRCFEAIALRTLLILYEGDYSGILQPGRHYVPLRKDHANMRDVAKVLADRAEVNRIIASAYWEVGREPMLSYGNFVALIDAKLSSICSGRGRVVDPYDPEEFVRRFGAFTSPFRWHLLRSKLLTQGVSLMDERLAPHLSPQAGASIRRVGVALRTAASDARHRRRKASLKIGCDPANMFSGVTGGVRDELTRLRSRLRVAASIASFGGVPTIKVRWDSKHRELALTPDASLKDDIESVTSIGELVACLRSTSAARVIWLPSSPMGLAAPLEAAEAEEFVYLAGVFSAHPELLASILPEKSAVVAVLAKQ